MKVLDPEKTRSQLDEPETGHGDEPRSGGHSRWMMIACCIPMLVIAGLLVASGAGFGFLVIALLCTVMMAAMMGGMSHGGGAGGKDGSA